MPTARRSQLLGQFEAVFRTAPAPAAKVLPFSSLDIQRDANRQQNATIQSTPLGAKSDKGDPTYSGTIASILDLRSCGNWLKSLLGAPTVGKAVTKQPTNVTGVAINYASADCTAGNGTLAYTAAATTATWTPQGGAAGAPVNIGADGTYTLEGGGGGKSINISVTAAALPVGNQNDADLNVSATLKAHAFPFNLNDRPSMLLEHGELDINKFFRYLGWKTGSLSSDTLTNEQNLAIAGMPATEVDPVPGAVFDANPTSYAHVRACAGGGKVWNGADAALGVITGHTWSLDNQLQPYPIADGLDGYGVIDQGDIVFMGTLRTVFDGAGAYDKARNGVSSRLRFQQTGLSGADTFGLYMDVPGVELTERKPPREGKSGLFAELTWRAHNNGASAPVIVLVNDVAAY